jgi:hypothetical protein
MIWGKWMNAAGKVVRLEFCEDKHGKLVTSHEAIERWSEEAIYNCRSGEDHDTR